jgi:hypothetical protein
MSFRSEGHVATSRVMSATECFANIQGEHRPQISPTVSTLRIHLENQKVVMANCKQQAEQQLRSQVDSNRVSEDRVDSHMIVSFP